MDRQHGPHAPLGHLHERVFDRLEPVRGPLRGAAGQAPLEDVEEGVDGLSQEQGRVKVKELLGTAPDPDDDTLHRATLAC